ncbi:MAG TPA: hypothetical protein VFP45_02065 [Candidatus Nitrosotalea sp.]|nr:hypothetical protein [Candidatus Nitrosotalea sp.]
MMILGKELFDEIWASSNYETVFCTVEEKDHYLSYLGSRKEIPRGMNIVLLRKKLNKAYTKEEIMRASPEKLREMTK